LKDNLQYDDMILSYIGIVTLEYTLIFYQLIIKDNSIEFSAIMIVNFIAT